MTTSILPAALKFYRENKRMTQQKLADTTKGQDKVSLPTIKRIESKDGVYRANDRVAKALAKALGIEIEELATAPSETADLEQDLRKDGYRPLRTMVDAETALAFNMVRHIYGIPIKSQIEMAPLFAALLAEGSLAWRRKRVKEIEVAADRLMNLGTGHLSFALAAYRVKDGAADELAAIESNDLFGEKVSDATFDLGFDPTKNNPFADYLREFAGENGALSVTFMDHFGWKTSEGLPEYRIGEDIIQKLTASDPNAEYALLRGHVRLKDIPEELLGDGKQDQRISWMSSRIPEEELAAEKVKRAKWENLNRSIDLGEIAPAQSPTVGGDDA